jgi:hypothetical protein
LRVTSEAAGEVERLTELLLPELPSLSPGEERVRAYLHLVEWALKSGGDYDGYLELALADCSSDPRLRAHVLPAMTQVAGGYRVGRIPEAETWASEALSGARLAGVDVERVALDALAWARSLRGLPIDDLCERFRVTAEAGPLFAASPERAAGQRLAWRGEVERARAVHTRLRSHADEQGQAVVYALVSLHLCELELRRGEWEAAGRLLAEMVESADAGLVGIVAMHRCRALLAAGRGLPSEAQHWAQRAIADAQETGFRWDLLEALRARGMAALLAREPGEAVVSLRAIWGHTEREGVEEPGALPVAPDLVEGLAELGELDEARVVSARLRELAEREEHPWALATAKRCDGMIGFAHEETRDAAVLLEGAAGDYGGLGLRFDRARTLLVLGRGQRRRRKWAASRAALEQAVAAYQEWARSAGPRRLGPSSHASALVGLLVMVR